MFNKEENQTINVASGATYIGNATGPINVHSNETPDLSIENLLSNIQQASVDLNSLDNRFQNRIHIDREETGKLYGWITKDLEEKESNIALLSGNAGYGKSVVLRDLSDILKENNIPALGIKVDKILNINSLKDIEAELNLQEGILKTFHSLSSRFSTIVLIIDQIDALSQSLSANRNAINTYDRLIKQLECNPNIRIIISCRDYDLDYDPILSSYKRVGNLFPMSLLTTEQVNTVLYGTGIKIDNDKQQLEEFLRIPLHLNLFCKVGLKHSFGNDITIQKLYDEIWSEYVEKDNGVASTNVFQLVTFIAERMYNQQHIVVDKRLFPHYSKELNFLLHHDLLRETSDNKIQFLHQTFFDYVYARTFLVSGKKPSEWLRSIHQGLFIRSGVKQIFSYLRELDAEAYIRELKTILQSDEYRFHLKLMLINDLGFYNTPLPQEKKFVKNVIIASPDFFRLFLESVYSVEWFKYLCIQEEFLNMLSSEDAEMELLINQLCTRITWYDARVVIDFLSKYPTKIRIIENVLMHLKKEDIPYSFDLYNVVSVLLRDRIGRYYYLKNATNSSIDFVIGELKKDFDEHIPKMSRNDDHYIPGEHEAIRLYEKIYNHRPDKAIPYFLYVIEQVVRKRQYKSKYSLYGDSVFCLYRPNPDNSKDCYKFSDIYDLTFSCIKNHLCDNVLREAYIKLLDSKLANVAAIGVYYLLQNVQEEKAIIVSLLLRENFFFDIGISKILKYYVKELLAESYSLLNKEQQEKINQSILSTRADYSYYHDKSDYTDKKISSNYLRTSYELTSMLPREYRNQYDEIRKLYQEGYRRYGHYTNEKPQRMTVMVGERSYPTKAYEKMSFDDWKNSFRKLNKEQSSIDDWNKPSKRGNERIFNESVAKEPARFYPLINDIVENTSIGLNYTLAGLEGLQKGEYDKNEVQDLCLKVLGHKRKELDKYNLSAFLRILRYLVHNNPEISRQIIDFVIEVIRHYPDREFEPTLSAEKDDGRRAIDIGINSIRGQAVQVLVDCYLLAQYKEEIFEALEFVADNANAATRACILYNGAWLNNLDKQRSFNLYLRLMSDYDPSLLAIPYYNGHPLLYHIYIDFNRLIPFFERAITVDEAGKPMVSFLLNAYLHDKDGALCLLKKLIYRNSIARVELVWILREILSNNDYNAKGWYLLNCLLEYDDKELGNKMDHCFLHIPPILDNHLVNFIDNYLKSPIAEYKSNEFYNFLRKLISIAPSQCLIWLFNSKLRVSKLNYHEELPANILIESYNGIREYEKDNPMIEKAMDVFDELLQIPKYRNASLRTFLNKLSS
jgi:hypothetical protein